MNYTTEIWKDVQGYEDYYQVSNFGRVKSLQRKVPYFSSMSQKHTTFTVKECILKKVSIPSGYLFVRISKLNKYKNFYVHRLVAQAFIPNPGNKAYINHKDGVKTNNHIDNIEWATPSENAIHALATGLKVSQKGEDQGKARLSNEQALKIKTLCLTKTAEEIRIMMNFPKKDRHLIANIKCGRIWKHLKVG